MTQEQQVIKWFEKHEYLNRVDAINSFSPPIWNLTAVISDMRGKGINIESVPMKEGKQYVKYRLVKEDGTEKDVNEVCNRQ